MLKITRTIVRRFWGATAFLVICLAVIVVIGRELTPQISRYKQDVIISLSEALGVNVSIKGMTATWEGLSPELRLSDVIFTSKQDENILSVRSATAKLSLLRSLFNWQLAWGNVELVQVEMGFKQNKDRSWSLIGLPETTTSSENINIDDPLDIFLLGRHIELRQADLSFQFRTGHTSKVKLPYVLMENSGNFHRLTSEIGVDGNTDVMTMVLEGEGDPRDLKNFSAKGYVRLQQFELERALATLPGELWEGLPEKEWREGHQLNLEVWVDIFPGMKVVSSGRFDVGELPVALEKDFSFPKNTGANFSSLWDENGEWSVSIRNLIFDWDDIRSEPVDLVMSSLGLGKPVNIQVESINVEPWVSTLNQAGYFGEKLYDALSVLKPSGTLNNLWLSIEGSKLDDVRLRAHLKDVSVGAWNGAPELKQVNGYVEATPLSGFIDLDSQNGFSMFYPEIYKESMSFDSANGRIHWAIDLNNQSVSVHSGLLEVNGEEGQGRGYFSLFTPFEIGEQQEELIIQVGLRNSVVGYHKKFVPFVVPMSLLDWMDTSIKEGRVDSGGFIYRGGFTAGSIKNTALQLYIDTEDASLNYHPDWPAITHASGEIWLNDDTITASVSSANFLGASAKLVNIVVAPDSHHDGINLSVDGELSGNAKYGLQIINETPIQSIIGTQFKDWKLDGDMVASVSLEIPIIFSESEDLGYEKVTTGKALGHQHVDVSFLHSTLNIPDVDLTFEKINGNIIYDDVEGLTAKKLTGTLWDKKIAASISKIVSKKTGVDLVKVSAKGKSSVESVRQWVDLPVLDFFRGESDFLVDVTIPYVKNDVDIAELSVTSALQGIVADLPQPLGKPEDSIGSLKVSLPLNFEKLSGTGVQEQVLNYQVEYAEILNGVFSIEDKVLKSAAVNLAASSEKPPQRPIISVGNFLIKGEISSFEYEEWLSTYNLYLEAEAQRSFVDNLGLSHDMREKSSSLDDQRKVSFGLKPVVNVKFEKFVMSDFPIDDLHLNAYWSFGAWMLNINSDIVEGDLIVFDDQNTPLIANLAHLHILTEDYDPTPRNPFLPAPEKKELGDALAEWNPKELPAVEFSVSEFTLNKEPYGSWSFDVVPIDSGVQLINITGEIRGGYVIGREQESGATVRWDIGENKQMTTHFSGRFVSDKFEEVLKQWKQPELLESEATKFDAELLWSGSPAAISTVGIEGSIKVLIEKGSFYQDEKNPSAGGAFLQLISFFNFDTWVRRLRLDFSDLTRKGMAFDQVEGALQFRQGEVLMSSPLIVKTASGRFQVVGKVDLVDETVDASLVATLPVGGNLTLFTAMAAGLPAAVGVYIISKIFEKQVDKVASVRYSVTGSLNDPDFEFDKLFGNKDKKENKKKNNKQEKSDKEVNH